MMLTTGIGVLAAALPLPEARAHPPSPDAPAAAATAQRAQRPERALHLLTTSSTAPPARPLTRRSGPSRPAREVIKDPTYWELPENIGQYRDDRRNVFVDGNSNLVLRAAKDGPTYFSGKVQSNWRGGVGHTWEARIKLNCLTPGAWPAYWLGNEDQGEIDVMEWYGNGSWPSATTVHAKANGGEWKTHNIAVDSAWHTWRCQWDEAGIRFWKDYADGAQPYFDCSGEFPAGLAVQRRRLHRLSGVQPRGRRFRWRRSQSGQLPGGHAGRLDTRLVAGRVSPGFDRRPTTRSLRRGSAAAESGRPGRPAVRL